MYTVSITKWTHDGSFKIDRKSTCIEKEITGETLKQAMSIVNELKMTNEMTKFTPWIIYDVKNADEQ